MMHVNSSNSSVKVHGHPARGLSAVTSCTEEPLNQLICSSQLMVVTILKNNFVAENVLYQMMVLYSLY